MDYWLELLTINHEILGSIPGLAMEIFLWKEVSHSNHGLANLVEFRINPLTQYKVSIYLASYNQLVSAYVTNCVKYSAPFKA